MLAEPLQLHLWDYDTFSRDDKLGHATLDLREIATSAPRQLHDFSVALSTQGVVHLQAWFYRRILQCAASPPTTSMPRATLTCRRP